MAPRRAVIVGAGIGGLAAAVELAAAGLEVVVLERAAAPGGKIRELAVGGRPVDSGPTVLTMRWVFERLFRTAGSRLEDHLVLQPAEVLARHAWGDGGRLDLFASRTRSADAIAAFAGPAEGRRYLDFCARAGRIYRTLEASFIDAARPSPVSLARRVGGLADLWSIRPFDTLWQALGQQFRDARLRQLFARYATYCGASPYAAPATLMLVAHVEQDGVWLVQGGMARLPEALARLAAAMGVTLRYRAGVAAVEVSGGRARAVTLDDGERIAADAILYNGDVAALPDGLLGPAARRAAEPVPRAARSQSALAWSMLARTGGFPLLRHNVFFGPDYAEEFDAVFRRGRLPREPTVYVCAQDRDAAAGTAPDAPERLFCLVNAPPRGDEGPLPPAEIERCRTRAFDLMARCGLDVDPQATATTTPADFAASHPGSGGALYGRAPHGWTASFRRPGAASRLPGLYLAGGSVHPGPGVPMAALSGRLAAHRLLADLAST